MTHQARPRWGIIHTDCPVYDLSKCVSNVKLVLLQRDEWHFPLFFPLLKSLLSKSSQPFSTTKISRHQRTLRFSSVAPNLTHAPSVNVNPFTPDTIRRNSEQQWRNRSYDDDDDYGRRLQLLYAVLYIWMSCKHKCMFTHRRGLVDVNVWKMSKCLI